jgi:hypothetical protein
MVRHRAYSEAAEYLYSPTRHLKLILILISMHLGPPTGIFCKGCQDKTFYAFLTSPIVPLNAFTVQILSEEDEASQFEIFYIILLGQDQISSVAYSETR